MVEKILNNTTPYGKIRASHEGSLHSSTLKQFNQACTEIERVSPTFSCKMRCYKLETPCTNQRGI